MLSIVGRLGSFCETYLINGLRFYILCINIFFNFLSRKVPLISPRQHTFWTLQVIKIICERKEMVWYLPSWWLLTFSTWHGLYYLQYRPQNRCHLQTFRILWNLRIFQDLMYLHNVYYHAILKSQITPILYKW